MGLLDKLQSLLKNEKVDIAARFELLVLNANVSY